jgi:DNA-binding LacI/PurR family transcriptional regulator
MDVKNTMNDSIDRAALVPPRNNRKDQAEELIKHYIQTHRIKPDEKLPSIRALSDHLMISRDSTWRALQALQEAGWLYSLPNRRYSVAEEVYTEILRSLKICALFTGEKYIQFAGFRRLADALRQACQYNNLDLKISMVPEKSKIPKSVWQGFDVLLVDSDCSVQLLDQFEEWPAPVIGLDAAYSNRYYANIVTDHMAGGSMVAEYMIQQGAQQVCIPYMRDSELNPRVKSRINGFTQTWLESGRGEESIATASIPWSRNNFQLSLNVKEYLEQTEIAPYYFVSDGQLAISFLDVCNYLSLSIPEAIKIVGYDGAQLGETTSPPMTTIQQDMDQMANDAIELIRNLPKIHELTAQNPIVRLKPHFVARGSA